MMTRQYNYQKKALSQESYIAASMLQSNKDLDIMQDNGSRAGRRVFLNTKKLNSLAY